MINEIFINGDSYSATTQHTTTYSQYLKNLTDTTVINQAMAGGSNDRIFRTTLEYCLGCTADKTPLIMIGFSFIPREETWLENIDAYAQKIKDYPGSKFVTTDWINYKDLDCLTKQAIIDQNINKQMINFYTKLFMLTQTLQRLGFPYFLFSAADNTDYKNLNWDSLRSLKLYQAVLQDPNIFDLHQFNIPKWAKDHVLTTTETGHLYTDGHEKFANFLYTKVVSKYLTQK